MAKIGFLGQKPKFWAQKKDSLLGISLVLATTGKSCSKKKVGFSQINTYSWADENLQILSSNTAILVEISTRITEFSERIQ